MNSQPTLPPAPAPDPATAAAAVTHYENFPVASWLCPPRLRQPIMAIYGFARTADDIADEGQASADQRLASLAQYRRDLLALGGPDEAAMLAQTGWPGVFRPLAFNVGKHQLPLHLLDDLLSAFIQDVEHTRDHSGYADRASLLDYCRRSANPVGRLLLHLYGIDHAQALAQSDAICSALQLINFWQDLSEDLPRARHYLNAADCAHHGVTAQALEQALAQRQLPAGLVQLLAEQAAWARDLMRSGSPLVHALPGRVGWELRLVVQGGLRILDKIDALQGRNLWQRPTIGRADAPRLLWRALRM